MGIEFKPYGIYDKGGLAEKYLFTIDKKMNLFQNRPKDETYLDKQLKMR
jgi:hypothetical protein